MTFVVGCGNRPIILLPTEFPETCLRRLGGLKSFLLFLPLFLSLAFFLKISLSLFGASSSSSAFGLRFSPITVASSSSLPFLSCFLDYWPCSHLQAYLFFKIAKKKSCQNVRNPHVFSPVERELYGWVDAEVFTQSSVLASEHLRKLRREMRLTQDLVSERDFVLEAAGPSDRLLFRALEDRTHFLWVYVELFTRLGVRLPFFYFQREVLTRCQVTVSQLHLNGWGFLRNFERVCLHFGFRPSWNIFLYTYQLHAPPPGNGFLSFRAYQGRRLFDAFEESIQEFKWHYFKVLPLPGTRPFWVDDEGKPFPWVYWNSEARECRITALDPLETMAFEFLQSLLVGLGKRSNFRCRWILDHSDAEVGAFLDSLLTDMEKQSRYDRLKQKMAEVVGVGPRSVLPHVRSPPTASGVSASGQAVPAPAPVASTIPVPPPAAAKKKGSSRDPSEKAFASKVQMEKELASLKDQVDVLTVERDSALAVPLLNAKIKSLTQELAVSEGERLSALARMQEVEEKAKVQTAQLESCRSALEKEKKGAEVLAKSLREKQAALDGAEAASAHWRDV
ncbi:hypothetical protein PIB30_069811 [Stylosanthes scabra]|uniref:Uncharacterized protein n=1 Tax=Stylosanthes scabra TaxID=79078 RepID=A0ABU6QNB6_9FABA|nr:hypothetical protein [Stylosanthes scabra]